jgi:hypothetical protein
MKWVMDSPNKFKLVDDEDPRPAVKLQSRAKGGAPTIKFVPSWKKYEKDLNLFDGADKFSQERDMEIKTNPKAARWEKSRKEYYQKEKHEWRTKELAKLREQGL